MMGSNYSSSQKIVYADTVPFVPNISEGYVVKVYDGDTFTVAFFMYGSKVPYRISVRLRGINAPEMLGGTPRKRVKAREAQIFLHSVIFNRTVSLKNLSFEKYGRLLADVFCDGVNINQLMLDNCYAKSYDGKKEEMQG